MLNALLHFRDHKAFQLLRIVQTVNGQVGLLGFGNTSYSQTPNSAIQDEQVSRHVIHDVHEQRVHADDAVSVMEHGHTLKQHGQQKSSASVVFERDPAEIRQSLLPNFSVLGERGD